MARQPTSRNTRECERRKEEKREKDGKQAIKITSLSAVSRLLKTRDLLGVPLQSSRPKNINAR